VIDRHVAITGLSATSGPYVPVTIARGTLVFVSGQVAFDERGDIVGIGDAYLQASQCLKNIDAALRGVGASRCDVAAITVYVIDIADRANVGRARADYFGEFLPASTLVEVSALVRDELLVEIAATAVISN
jgi:enamine deaminase RidA (YjgF/YER057c/UK114 family)